MFFENYGHIVKPRDIKMLEWTNVSRKDKKRGTEFTGPPVGVLEIEKKPYGVRGWSIAHKLMSLLDSDYDLTIPELKQMAYCLLLDEDIHFHKFFNSVLQDADNTKNYLILCDENDISEVSEHTSSTPDTTFDTILCQDWLTWEYEKIPTPYRTRENLTLVPSLLLKSKMKNYSMTILIQSLKKNYFITTRISRGTDVMRPIKHKNIRKKYGFEVNILDTIKETVAILSDWASKNEFIRAYRFRRNSGWMSDIERDDIEHDFFLNYFAPLKKN